MSSTGIPIDGMIQALTSFPISDIYVPGYIDSGCGSSAGVFLARGASQFHPMSDDIYLEIGAVLLRCRAIDQHSKMCIEEVDKIECSFDIDPDDAFGIMSVIRMSLQSGRDYLRVHQLDVFIGEPGDLGRGIVAAVGMLSKEGDYLFLDPLDFNGIHLGGAPSRDIWVDRWGQRYLTKTYAIG